MTIEEKLNSIRQTKEAIKTSIRNKGVELEDTAPFNTYSSKIDEIETQAIIETENIEITPTKETQTINRSEDKYIESVKVNAIPDEYIVPSGELEITENGQYDVTDKVSVNVEIASSGGSNYNLGLAMREIDMVFCKITNRKYTEKDYAEQEIERTQKLLDFIGGVN